MKFYKHVIFLTVMIALSLISNSTNVSAQVPSTLGWSEIPNTKIAGNDPSCTGTCGAAINYSGSRMVIVAWGGGIFDTTRNRMIVWGGGHGDYAGNEQYAVLSLIHI